MQLFSSLTIVESYEFYYFFFFWGGGGGGGEAVVNGPVGQYFCLYRASQREREREREREKRDK